MAQLGITLWIVWTSRCSRSPRIRLGRLLTRDKVPTSLAPPWNPLEQPGADLAPSGPRRRGDGAAGPVPGPMTGIPSRWAGWPPAWSPSVDGQIGSLPEWCSPGGPSWWVPRSPGTPSRCHCTTGNCWSAPAPRPGPPNSACSNANSSPGSPPASAQAWSPAYAFRAPQRPTGCTAPATSAAVAPVTPTADPLPAPRCVASPCPVCRAPLLGVSRSPVRYVHGPYSTDHRIAHSQPGRRHGTTSRPIGPALMEVRRAVTR
ncbi:MAG: hypothetical protein QOG46_1845 [Pseudonocardiales bacterium]|jgi:hypothetical protein|nr:hypothetical protein [Pseudonocardiales bacterium]